MFSISILGSSAAMPTPFRIQTSQIVTINNTRFLVDCGDGTFNQILRLGVSTKNLKYILISHLHSDHFGGIMNIILCLGMQSRQAPLYIYAPADLEDFIKLYLKISQTSLDFELIFTALPFNKTDIFLETDNFSVQTIPLNHRIEPCNGFLFTQKHPKRKLFIEKLPKDLPAEYYIALQAGKDVLDEKGEIIFSAEEYSYMPPDYKYAYCSDTKYKPELIPLLKDVDILYHEATFLHKDIEKATRTNHSTALQAGQMAKDCNAKKLVLGHFSIRYPDVIRHLEEAKSVFENTFCAEDGAVFEIS